MLPTGASNNMEVAVPWSAELKECCVRRGVIMAQYIWSGGGGGVEPKCVDTVVY
jgi:hypothetical protein